ncbi:hypothetical protein CPI84_04375 [Erwinia pyrifoliae]|nr:hypothetical protein CPI84_04375 [Erwinia pyrifoliae]MCA8877982.1 transposase [Erwinia pyrifoliae]
MALEFIKPGKPAQSAFIARFNRTCRTDVLNFYPLRTLNQVREITGKGLGKCYCIRPHAFLKI